MKKEMHESINKYGLNHIKTIEESQKLDKKIVEEQLKLWETWKSKRLKN